MPRTRSADHKHQASTATSKTSKTLPTAGVPRLVMQLLVLIAVIGGLAGSSGATRAPPGNATVGEEMEAEAESELEESGETMVDGSADVGGAGALKPSERFRRLIPYMTFYFAQQGLGQQPHFQQYEGPAPVAVLPPRYQGNLAVPAGYLVRGKTVTPVLATARPPQPFRTAPAVAVSTTTAQPPHQPQPQLQQPQRVPAQRGPAPHPRPFTLAYDPLLYAPPLAPPTPPPPPPPPRPVAPGPPPLTPEQRTAALFRLLVLLQQQRRAPQPQPQPQPQQHPQQVQLGAAPVSAGSVAALAQTLALLQAAQSLPGEAPGAVAKLLAQQLLLAPPRRPAPPAPPTPPPARIPVAALYGARLPQQHHQNQQHRLAPAKAAALLPFQVTTLSPDVSPDLLYNTVSPSPAPAAPPTPTPPPAAAARPTPLAPVDDVDLQNYLTPVRIAHVEVRPNGHDVHSPLKLVPTTSTAAPPPPPAPPAPPQPPTPPPPPPSPALRPYGYAPKAPPADGPAHAIAPARVTFTQSFPDPDAEGGTPGRPGVDYPTLATIPPTAFDCKAQRYKGFFGDPETHCQVWHYCDLNGGQASFLCPNGTIFSQVALTCDWWFNVRCASTTQLYVLNERLYKYILPVMPSFPEDFQGPLVDQYLTLKFREQEQKSKAKAKAKAASSASTTPKPSTAKPPPKLPSAEPTQNTLEDLEDR